MVKVPSRSCSKGSTTRSFGSTSSTASDSPRRRYQSSTFWDKWYQNNGDSALEWSGSVNNTVLNAITEVLSGIPKQEPLKICELGCGCSKLAPMLQESGVEVVGVDFSQEVINANKARHPHIRWVCADALSLASHFDAGYFDAIVGKTLIDCFLTRTDANGSIRQLMEQCHTVLKDHGFMMLLDKAGAETIIGRGKAQQLTVDKHKTMTFRVLQAHPRCDHTESRQRQWELEIEPTLHKHFVVRPAAAGSGSLQVWSTDNVAVAAGIETGDLVVGYRKRGSKNVTVGNANETALAIRSSTKRVTLLMERPAAGAARRKTASLKTRLQSRQSTSQQGPKPRCTVIVGLTLSDLAGRMGLTSGLQLDNLFLGRGLGAVFGTMLGGWLCDMCPIKVAMSCCIFCSCLSVAAVPFAAATGSHLILSFNFFLLGCCGSALVSFTVSAACWSFPGKEVGPVLAACNGAFGMTSAALPMVFKALQLEGHAVVEYSFVSFCALPSLALLLASQAPTRPVDRLSEISDLSHEEDPRQVLWKWFAVLAAAVAQFLFSGANAALLSWIVSYSASELQDPGVAPLLVSILQGSLMVGSFSASKYQAHFALWDLARWQVLAVLAGLVWWLPFSNSTAATKLALAWYGLAGGPLVTYCSTLLNQHCSPSGVQLAVINVGGNFGASAGPFIVGMLMIKSGPRALPCSVSGAFLAALLGFVFASLPRQAKGEPLLGN
ncbi:unnamed protein product [Effrenium voratum]|nr:unnamed protein product [Effrenium voratum]